MESIDTYVKSINQLKKIRSYLREADIRKITINFSIMDSTSAEDLRSYLYGFVSNIDIDNKLKKQIYSDIYTIEFDKLYPNDKSSKNIFKQAFIYYCTSRIVELGNLIGSDTTSAY